MLQAIEKQHKTSCMFLDFAKAFDIVNHDILIKKLEYYGIRGKPLNLLISYLSNRKQAVKIDQTLSSFQKNYLWCSTGKYFGTSFISHLY